MKRPALLIASACACAAIASPAGAKQCPSGQIFRVSKGVCMQKAAALKAGIVVSTPGQRAPEAATRQPPPRPESLAETVVEKAAPERAEAQVPSEVSPEFNHPQLAQAFSRRSPSPFGELRFDYFQR